MYKLWNRLFGWEYVCLKSPAMDYRYVRRIHQNKYGEKYVFFNDETAWFLLDDGKTDSGYKWQLI